MQTIVERFMSGERLDPDKAWRLYQELDLHMLGHLAHQVRRKKSSPDHVTYVIDRNINYSNVCVCGCQFCAFFRPVDHPEAYLLSREKLGGKIEETLALGGTQILMQGGHHPSLPLSFYEDMLRFIKGRYPTHIHAFSPPEIVHFSKLEKVALPEVIAR